MATGGGGVAWSDGTFWDDGTGWIEMDTTELVKALRQIQQELRGVGERFAAAATKVDEVIAILAEG